MTDQLTSKLKHLAECLPKDEYKASFTLIATGEELVKKFPDLTLIPGGIMDPDKVLVVTDPNENECNHFRRIKRAYNVAGKGGVAAYMLKYTIKEKQFEVKRRVLTFL